MNLVLRERLTYLRWKLEARRLKRRASSEPAEKKSRKLLPSTHRRFLRPVRWVRDLINDLFYYRSRYTGPLSIYGHDRCMIKRTSPACRKKNPLPNPRIINASSRRAKNTQLRALGVRFIIPSARFRITFVIFIRRVQFKNSNFRRILGTLT